MIPFLNRCSYFFVFLIWSQSGLMYLLTSAKVCQFPDHWSGSWFQKGIHEKIRITKNSISDKGNCTANDKYKFLIYNSAENCARCMAIYEKHYNVLQYKETYCASGPRHLNDLCDEINGDAPLFSLFRLDTPPVPCPFSGYFKFTYNRGRGECKDPPSTIDSCTDENHLLFRFQACTDIQGSESKVVTLECYATWKGGSVKYLVGKFLHPSAKDEDDRFHCFVFEQGPGSTYHLAQSADASCEGLEQTLEGSATMELTRTERLENKCSFPDLAIKGQYWQTLDGLLVYDFGHESSFNVYHKTNGTLLRFVNCTQHDPASDAFVVYSTTKCDIGYICMKIVKRSDNIIDIIQGDMVKSLGDACLNFNKYDYITLTVLKSMDAEETFIKCPLEGIYDIKVQGNEVALRSSSGFPMLTLCSERSILVSQCLSPDQMRFEISCGSNEPTFKYFQCSGLWHENGTNYLLVYSSEDGSQYCLSYKESEASSIKASISNTNCRPSRKAQQLSNSYSNNNYDYQRNSQNSYDLFKNHSESINFELSNEGLCYATGHGSSNFHINKIMLGPLFEILLISLTILIKGLFSSL